MIAEELRMEITKRCRRLRVLYGSKDIRVGEWHIVFYGPPHGRPMEVNARDEFTIMRRRRSTGLNAVEFYSDRSIGRRPDYDEWHRILEALKQEMVLDDLASL